MTHNESRASGLSDRVRELADLIAPMPKPVARPWGEREGAERLRAVAVCLISVRLFAMRISRHGSERNHGSTLLAKSPMVATTPPTKMGRPAPLRPDWDVDTGRLEISVRGLPQGNTTHTYRIEFSVDELAEMVETATDEGCVEQSSKAIGKALAAFLRAAFVSPSAT